MSTYWTLVQVVYLHGILCQLKGYYANCFIDKNLLQQDSFTVQHHLYWDGRIPCVTIEEPSMTIQIECRSDILVL
jgi:hypothetical protein